MGRQRVFRTQFNPLNTNLVTNNEHFDSNQTPHPDSYPSMKTQSYFSQATEAASRSPMNFRIGAIVVKGGKVIAGGFNHHRSVTRSCSYVLQLELLLHSHHYDGADNNRRKPASMHAEMHAITNACGQFTPSFSRQQQRVQGPQRPRNKPKRSSTAAVGEAQSCFEPSNQSSHHSKPQEHAERPKPPAPSPPASPSPHHESERQEQETVCHGPQACA